MKRRIPWRAMSMKGRHPIAGFLLVVYAAVVLVPIILAVVNSFKSASDIQNSFLTFNFHIANLNAYKASLLVLRFWQGLGNNVIIMAMTLSIAIPAASLMGYAVTVVNTKFLRLAFVVMILLICIPANVTIIKLIPILKYVGLLNTRLGASLVYAALILPVAVFLYTGFMRTLPKELYESAIVEGSGIFQTYRFIYMPLMKTITGSVVIFSSTTVWNDFLVSVVTLGSFKVSTLVPRLYALNSSTFTRWDLVFSSSILVSLPVIVLYVLLQRAFERGMLSGALKG